MFHVERSPLLILILKPPKTMSLDLTSPAWALYQAEKKGYHTIQDFTDQLWKIRYHKHYQFFSIEHESGETYCHHECLTNSQAQEAINEILIYSL